MIFFAVQKFWRYTPSATGSYGRQGGWLAGWLVDEMQVNFKFLKFIIDQNFKLFAVFNKDTALLEQYVCVYVGIIGKSLF